MTIVTENSTYTVIPDGQFFVVTKVAETSHNPNGIHLGWWRLVKTIEICIGGHAYFNSIHTSIVQSVKD